MNIKLPIPSTLDYAIGEPQLAAHKAQAKLLFAIWLVDKVVWWCRGDKTKSNYK